MWYKRTAEQLEKKRGGLKANKKQIIALEWECVKFLREVHYQWLKNEL